MNQAKFTMQEIIDMTMNRDTERRKDESAQLAVYDLGRLIKALEAMPPESNVVFDFANVVPGELNSYRGYYCDLAVSFNTDGLMRVSDFLHQCRMALGKVFEGYKGGDFKMDEATLIHVANYGRTSNTRIVGAVYNGYETILKTSWIKD